MMRLSSLLVICAIIVCTMSMVRAADPPMHRVLVRDAVGQGAMCMDGSAPGYYLRAGTLRKWIIHLEGPIGGWCLNQTECESWTNTTRGSSATWPSDMPGLGGLLSADATVNPDFYHYHHAFVKSCDGASFLGNVSDRAFGTMYFRGRLILTSLIQHMLAVQGLNDATHVIITGCGSGGMAVYLHLNYIRSLIPARIDVHGLADAGYYHDGVNWDGGWALQPAFRWMMTAQNAVGSLSPKCVLVRSVADRYECMFPSSMIIDNTYIMSPLFIAQPIYQTDIIERIVMLPKACRDSLKTGGAGCTATQFDGMINQWMRVDDDLTAFVKQTPQSAAWLLSCQSMCQTINNDAWTKQRVDSISLSAAFSAWYFRRSPVLKVDLPYDQKTAPYFNPTCVNT